MDVPLELEAGLKVGHTGCGGKRKGGFEGGPPAAITEAFDELFTAKVAATKIACAKARAKMGWPARRDL